MCPSLRVVAVSQLFDFLCVDAQDVGDAQCLYVRVPFSDEPFLVIAEAMVGAFCLVDFFVHCHCALGLHNNNENQGRYDTVDLIENSGKWNKM